MKTLRRMAERNFDFSSFLPSLLFASSHSEAEPGEESVQEDEVNCHDPGPESVAEDLHSEERPQDRQKGNNLL